MLLSARWSEGRLASIEVRERYSSQRPLCPCSCYTSYSGVQRNPIQFRRGLSSWLREWYRLERLAGGLCAPFQRNLNKISQIVGICAPTPLAEYFIACQSSLVGRLGLLLHVRHNFGTAGLKESSVLFCSAFLWKRTVVVMSTLHVQVWRTGDSSSEVMEIY